MPDEISREVDQFIRDHINSVEQLEVLLLLAENPQQQWSAAEVAQKLYRQPESIGTHLQSLQSAGLVVTCSGAPGRYCYNTTLGAIDLTIKALERAYHERKDTVIRLIFSRPPDPARSFAAAFRFRKTE